jgi:hypothetical protein
MKIITHQSGQWSRPPGPTLLVVGAPIFGERPNSPIATTVI